MVFEYLFAAPRIRCLRFVRFVFFLLASLYPSAQGRRVKPVEIASDGGPGGQWTAWKSIRRIGK